MAKNLASGKNTEVAMQGLWGWLRAQKTPVGLARGARAMLQLADGQSDAATLGNGRVGLWPTRGRAERKPLWDVNTAWAESPPYVLVHKIRGQGDGRAPASCGRMIIRTHSMGRCT